MKLIRRIIPLFILGIMVISACKKDLSTLDTNKINGVSIDTAGMGILNIFQFEHLVIKPKISTELKDVSYEWRVNLVPGDTVTSLLSTEKDLDAEIRFKPNRSGNYHQLTYTVTDKSNGLKYITTWKLNVRNSIGQGLVIAESLDGTSTDISHIMSPLVTADYTGESVKRNIYSAINGATFPGIVKQMRFNPEAVILFGITNSSIFKINTIDYTLGGTNADLFFSHPGEFKPAALGGLTQGDLYVEDGKLTGNYFAVTKKFGLPFDSPNGFKVPAQIAVNRYLYPDAYLNFYDEGKGYFVYQQSMQSFGDRGFYALPSTPTKAFNGGNLPGKVNLAAGVGVDQDFLHLLKDKTTGKVNLYVLSKAGFDYDDYVSIPPEPKVVYDLSNAPGINEATQFVICDDQKVMYYATESKIYAMIFSTSTPIFEERYTAPASEQITTLQMFQDSDYPYGDGPFLPTNNRQLIMSTYHGTEGKVYILPIKNIGVGNIDLPNIKTYGGFGKISAITTQK